MSINEMFKKLKKTYGSLDVFQEMTEIDVISTGSPAFDDAIGPWGLPRGKFIQFAGAESSGKTLMSLLVGAQWQKENDKNWFLFVDAEHTFNMEWAESLGVDSDRVMVLRESDGVEIFKYLCGVPNKEYAKRDKKTKMGILDEAIEMGGSDESGLGLIIIDSVASIVPPIEAIKQVGNTNMSPLARFLPDALRRLTPLLSKSGIMCIAINQIRMDIGVMYGNPETSPGGKSLKHACSLMANFKKVESKKQMFLNKNDEPYGHTMTVRIDKNKVGPPKRTCEFDITYEGGIINKHKEVSELGIYYNVVNRPNTTIYEYNGEKLRGREQLYQYVLENDLTEKMLEEVKQAKLEKKHKEEIILDDDQDESQED